MVRKCKGITEISVMEVAQVGVRTRTRALAMAAASRVSNKRRKGNNGEIQMSTSYFQLGSTTSRDFVMKPENSAPSVPEQNSGRQAMEDVRCWSPSPDHASVSCCSSNGSGERFKAMDTEDKRAEVETSATYYSSAEREPTPTSELQEESGDLDSTGKPYKANSCPISTAEKKPSTAGKMPPEFELELEEFFAEAEKKLKQEFTEKYNFDVQKGEPLVGRYEWVRAEK